MEGFSNQERRIEKNEVIELLETRGIDDTEVAEIVLQWTKQQEEIATTEGTAKASIEFNMSRADLYVAIGDISGALECLEDARIQAHQENEEELYSMIMKKMDQLEGE